MWWGNLLDANELIRQFKYLAAFENKRSKDLYFKDIIMCTEKKKYRYVGNQIFQLNPA